jgi:outer membrane protein assembly factor BamB
VTLEAGDEKVLPVSLRWVVAEECPEAVAVDGDVVYYAGDSLFAFRLSDGTEIWSAGDPEGYALCASGEVEIGGQGTDEVRVLAPFEYDLTVKRSTGHVVRFDQQLDGETPSLEPFPAPEPQRFDIETDLDQIVARNPDGSVAWRITIDEPMSDALPPIGVPGGLVLATSSGHLLMLEYR